MDNTMQNQLNGFKQQVAASGFSGEGIIDIRPGKGVIRIKVNTVPPEKAGEFTLNFSQMLAMLLAGLNISVKVHVSREDNGGE